MEKLFEQLKGYLHMDTEISYEEFSAYYQEVIGELNQNYQGFSQDDLIKARYICSIIQTNAQARGKASKTNGKAFKKMGVKAAFWADAINYRLNNEGMTQGEIDEATEKLNESV